MHLPEIFDISWHEGRINLKDFQQLKLGKEINNSKKALIGQLSTDEVIFSLLFV